MGKLFVSIGLLAVLALPLTSFSQEAEKYPLSDAGQADCDYVFELSSVGDVCFPHKSHRKLKCPTCHHQSRATPLETPHPEYLTSSWHSCESCHDPETERQKTYRSCRDCHLPDPDNIADETPSAKVAMHENCWKCHERGTGAQASAKCPDCHQKDGQ